MSASNSFSAVLQDLMTDKGISQKQLARQADLNETAIRDIIKGKSRNPRRDTLLKIARALECDPALMLRYPSGQTDYVASIPFYGAITPRRPDTLFAQCPVFLSIPLPHDLMTIGSTDLFAISLEEQFQQLPANSLVIFRLCPSGTPDALPRQSPVLFEDMEARGWCRLDLPGTARTTDQITAFPVLWSHWNRF